MANLLTISLALCVVFLGGSTALPAPKLKLGLVGMTELGALTAKGRKYSVSNRVLKLVEAESECRKYGAELVTIENAAQSLEVERFIRPYELAGVWTGGVPDSWDELSYKWNSNSEPIEYTNWIKDSAPKKEDFGNEREWKKSGIALTDAAGWKWELLDEINLYQALCVTPPPCPCTT